MANSNNENEEIKTQKAKSRSQKRKRKENEPATLLKGTASGWSLSVLLRLSRNCCGFVLSRRRSREAGRCGGNASQISVALQLWLDLTRPGWLPINVLRLLSLNGSLGMDRLWLTGLRLLSVRSNSIPQLLILLRHLRWTLLLLERWLAIRSTGTRTEMRLRELAE